MVKQSAQHLWWLRGEILLQNISHKITTQEVYDILISSATIIRSVKRGKSGGGVLLSDPLKLHPVFILYWPTFLHLFCVIVLHLIFSKMLFCNLFHKALKIQWNHYRGIALASSKLLEWSILLTWPRIFCDLQFGFKEWFFHYSLYLNLFWQLLSIDMWRAVHAYVIDASKAIDTVDHYLLFKRLLDRDMPIYSCYQVLYLNSIEPNCLLFVGLVMSHKTLLSLMALDKGSIESQFVHCLNWHAHYSAEEVWSWMLVG